MNGLEEINDLRAWSCKRRVSKGFSRGSKENWLFKAIALVAGSTLLTKSESLPWKEKGDTLGSGRRYKVSMHRLCPHEFV